MIDLFKSLALFTPVVSYLLLAVLYSSRDSQHTMFVLEQHFIFSVASQKKGRKIGERKCPTRPTGKNRT